MDRTAKEVLNLYQNSNVDRQRYMFSLALLGDVQGRSMRGISRRFQGLRKDDPKQLTHGFQDMSLDHDNKATNGMRQALHDIKQSGKGLDDTLEADNLLAKHFMNASTGGMLTTALGGQVLRKFSQKHSDEQTPDVRLKKSDDDGSKSGSPAHGDERAGQVKPADARPKKASTTASDMNQTNVRRHMEEESEVDNKLARDKKKRMRAQRQMKNKGPHM